MSKAQQNILDAIATITGNLPSLMQSLEDTQTNLKGQRRAFSKLQSKYDKQGAELALNAAAVAELKGYAEQQRQRADTAERELATLRRQVDALFTSRQAFGARYQQSAAVYGQGAGDLDTRDNGLVQHGDHAE